MLAFHEELCQTVLLLELGVAVLALVLPGRDTCRGILFVPTGYSVTNTLHPDLERRLLACVYVIHRTYHLATIFALESRSLDAHLLPLPWLGRSSS